VELYSGKDVWGMAGISEINSSMVVIYFGAEQCRPRHGHLDSKIVEKVKADGSGLQSRYKASETST
jgi:hypothetical protein